ncbi:hypothetical protein EC844_12532 [Acinetobacter calcoaceticus]|uniref:Phage tail protein n=1 Tax=Acinetobacter calcoaceticus TaxID=471 RepID=A0A4R1XEY5_ACICA|nr:hypothetical protein EC844_12532 [Acinetobacter calcoaceticus]
MSSGAKQITKYGIETAPGVVAAKWQTLGFTSNSIDAAPQTTESQTIKDSRVAAGTFVTGVEIQGDVETEFAYGIQDELLECVAFNSFKGDVLTFGGKVRKTVSFVRGFEDVENYHTFTGCHINQWALSIPDQGIVTSKFSVMGMGRTPSTAPPTGTSTPAPDAIQFTSLSVGDILIDGIVKAGMCISQLDLTIDNTMQVQKCLGKQETSNIGAILETTMKGSGSVTISWSKNTAELYEKQFTNAPVSLSYSLKDSIGNIYKLDIPKVQLSGGLPSGSAGDLLTTQFSFTVADVAPTLTRTLFVKAP